MADTIIGAHDGTFKTDGSISMRETQEFLARREGLSTASFHAQGLEGSVSLQKLYDASNPGGIVLAGNSAYPSNNYSLGGLRGASYQNNTPPVISLLGPNMFWIGQNTEVQYADSFVDSALIGTSWRGYGTRSETPDSDGEYNYVVCNMTVDFTSTSSTELRNYASLSDAYSYILNNTHPGATVSFADTWYFMNEWGNSRVVGGSSGTITTSNWVRIGEYVYFEIKSSLYTRASSNNSQMSWFQFPITTENIENNLVAGSGWTDKFNGKSMYTADYEMNENFPVPMQWWRVG